MKKLDLNIKVLMAIIVLLGLSLGLMAQQQPRHTQFQQMGNSASGVFNLSDEQKTDMKEIHIAQIKEAQPLKDELLINRAKINSLIKKDNPDMKEIVSLIEANGKILTEIQVNEIESKIKFRALLNDEQKVMFDSQFGKMGKKRAMTQHRSKYMNKGRGRI